jgi:hypothetical protein
VITMTLPPAAGEAAEYRVGDVILDSHGNPAVVFQVEHGKPLTICPCAGPGRGQLAGPPRQLTRVTDPQRVEQARVVGREAWRRLAGLRPATAVTVADTSRLTRTPTDEQQAVLDAFARGVNLVVNAYAGSGKTTLLRMLAEAFHRKAFTYIAYNSSAKKDAARSFPSNARCYTSHGLAFQPMIAMAQRLGGGKYMSGIQLAKLMRITHPARLTANRMLAPGQVASIVRMTIQRFCYSADEVITGKHLPLGKLKHFTDPDEIEALGSLIPPIARRVWERDICADDGQMPMAHDYYLKAFALTHPRLPGDVILLDEAQDSNECVSAMVLEQIQYGTQVVMVGDTYQQIYEWRGAVNAMATFARRPGVVVLPLTQSFRFGEPIAAEANKVLLGILGAAHPLRGFAKIQSRIGKAPDHPDAVICRTNAEALKQAIDYLGQGLKVAFPKGTSELIGLTKAARDIKAGRPCEHPDLMAFATWGQLQDYVETEPDGEDLKRFVDLVDEHGVDELLDLLQQIGSADKGGDHDIVITTGHGAKGLEWAMVQIAGDFREPKRDPEKPAERPEIPPELARLIYVAITRGMYVLDNAGVTWLDDYLPASLKAVA